MQIFENPELNKVVEKNNPMKEWLVNYVGNLQKDDVQEITTEMIVETMAVEFPEFLMAVAEENYIRGYEQALDDAERGWELLQKIENKEQENEQ